MKKQKPPEVQQALVRKMIMYIKDDKRRQKTSSECETGIKTVHKNIE